MSELQPHQVRMLEELKQLQTRTTALDAFMDTENFQKLDVTERTFLKDQRNGMRIYQEALEARVRRFHIGYTSEL